MLIVVLLREAQFCFCSKENCQTTAISCGDREPIRGSLRGFSVILRNYYLGSLSVSIARQSKHGICTCWCGYFHLLKKPYLSGDSF